MVERATATTTIQSSSLCSSIPESTNVSDAIPATQPPEPEQVDVVRLAGNIKFHIAEWNKITNDKVVLSAVLGFKIPFIRKPLQVSEPKYGNLSPNDMISIREALTKILKTKAVEKCTDEIGQFISTVFTVPKSDGGCRFVINLKGLNEFVESPHFKMEDIRMVMALLKQNSHMVVIDQCEAFHRIPVWEQHRKFLRFRWEDQLYQFTCLPFGLNVSPWLFTKLMKPVVGYLRSKGYESVSYLDDSLLFGNTKNDCNINKNSMIALYNQLGLHVNYKKSQLVPSQSVKYLGFIFNSQKLTIELPETKVRSLKQKCEHSLTIAISIQELAELVGHLNSATPAIKYSPLYIRELENLKINQLRKSNGNYLATVSLSSRSHEDLRWWIRALEKPYQIIPTDSFDITLVTDASMSGWGATDLTNSTKGGWTAQQMQSHINVLELLAVFYGIKALVKQTGVSVLIRVDNTTAVSYINRYGGCRASECHEVARMIWQYCETKNLYIRASYINKKLNIADSLSRESIDSSDFSLSSSSYEKIKRAFFEPVIDLFATHMTRKCSRFVSWLPDPESEAVDAFSIKWENNFYAFPPFNMIAKVLKKIELDKVFGIVVVPCWSTQAWYPRFIKMKRGKLLKIKPSKNLLFCPYENRFHELSNKTTLLAAVLCSSALRTSTLRVQ